MAHTPVCADDFNRADNTSLGSNWAESPNGFQIASNALTFQSTGVQAAIWIANTISPNPYAQLKITTLPQSEYAPGPLIRAPDTGANGAGYGISVRSDGLLRMTRQAGGVWDSATGAVVAGDTVCIEDRGGGQIVALINGVDLHTYSDGSPLTGTYCGLFAYYANSGSPALVVDDWEAGTWSTDEVPTGTSGGLVVGSATSFVGEGFVGAIEAASGSYTLVAAQGSYALSGQAAGLRASRILTAAQGGYALTGQAAALRKSYPLTAAHGSYSLSGQPAGLIAARTMAAAQGSYALNGQAANLRYSKTLAAAQGAYSLTGQDAALRVTRTMVAGQGSYNLSGQAANLFAARQVTAEQGAYSLTGMAAGLLYSGASPTLIAGMGSYSLTGQDVALRRTAILLAAQGDYTITGQVAGLRADRVLSAATGFYTLTGEPADLLVTIPPAVTLPPAGGDDVPDRGHRGWDRKRSRLKLHREREFTEQIRDLYRELTGDPRTAARAEAILAPIVAAVPAAGESEAAREAALEARAEALRARADALEADAMQAEIALRLLHRELRDWQEDDDLEAIQLLLSQVL